MWLDRICDAGSEVLTLLLYNVVPERRAGLVAVLQNLRTSLREVYEAKFEMWKHLPLMLLGMGNVDDIKAKECARNSRAEWDGCGPDKSRVHRVAQRFFGDPLVRQHIDAFCDGGQSLHEFPELNRLVLSYCRVNLVERAIEGEHAKIENVVKHGPATPATVCARIRSKYLLSLMSDPTFTAWCMHAWSTHVMRSLLSVLHNNSEMKGWSATVMKQHIYLYGIDDQFQDVSAARTDLALWDAARWSVLKPIEVAPNGTETLALEYWRYRLTIGRTFCIPRDLLRIVSYAAYEPFDRQPFPLQGVLSMLSCDQILHDVCDATDLVFFRIINTHPNRRVLEHPWHLGGRPRTLAINMLRCRSEAGERGRIVDVAADVVHLDLLYWCGENLSDVLQSLWSFGSIQYGTELVVRDALLALADSCFQHPVLSIEHDALSHAHAHAHASTQLQRLEASPAGSPHKLLSTLLQRECFSDIGRYTTASIMITIITCCWNYYKRLLRFVN